MSSSIDPEDAAVGEPAALSDSPIDDVAGDVDEIGEATELEADALVSEDDHAAESAAEAIESESPSDLPDPTSDDEEDPLGEPGSDEDPAADGALPLGEVPDADGDLVSDEVAAPDGDSSPSTAVEGDRAANGSETPSVISIWPVWSWTMVGVLVVVIGLSVGVGLLSRTLFLDIISFWPALVFIVLVLAAIFPRVRKGAPRLSAVIPLLLLTYLGVTISLHAARWDRLPSTVADVYGPVAADVTDARIELDLVGRLSVAPVNQEELYRILMTNGGGDTGAPTALEIVDVASAAISVGQRVDPGWFTSSGWNVDLSRAATWEIDAKADTVDIDLSAVTSAGVTVQGDGVVILGLVRPGSTVELDGIIELRVRDGDHIDVIGQADVPEDWTTTGLGTTTPGDADPFTVVVAEGARITIRDR